MTTLISGPMRGVPYFNFPHFDEIRDMLIARGDKVISPADMDREVGFDAMTLPKDDWDWEQFPPQLDKDSCIRRDLAAVLVCDKVYMLYGWWNSVGSRAEYAVAKWAGKEIEYEDSETPYF